MMKKLDELRQRGLTSAGEARGQIVLMAALRRTRIFERDFCVRRA